jgi:hypothetical protein
MEAVFSSLRHIRIPVYMQDAASLVADPVSECLVVF